MRVILAQGYANLFCIISALSDVSKRQRARLEAPSYKLVCAALARLFGTKPQNLFTSTVPRKRTPPQAECKPTGGGLDHSEQPIFARDGWWALVSRKGAGSFRGVALDALSSPISSAQ